MKKIILFIVALLLLLLVILGLLYKPKQTPPAAPSSGKNILIVHSYHPESKGVIRKSASLIRILNEAGVDHKSIYMDTRRNPGEEFKKKAALAAKDTVARYAPDVLITFDDNAFKYLVMPYFKDAELPVVFVGIDWDASIYGAPYSNTTGIISVGLAAQLVDYMKEYASGERVAWLGYDTYTARKETKAYKGILGIKMTTHYVTNINEWKTAFLKLQTETDMIIHSGMLAEMKDWSEQDAFRFVQENIKVPVGTVNTSTMGCSIFGLAKISDEQGEWAAQTALKIMAGSKPSDIPQTRNKKGQLLLNLDHAEKLDIVFAPKLLKHAEIYNRKK